MRDTNRPAKSAAAQVAPAELEALLKRCDKGDKKALAKLGDVMKQFPAIRDALGDLAVQAENAWVKTALGEQEVSKRALHSKLADMRREIAGKDSSALEALLAQRIAACWLQVQYADAIYAQSIGGSISLAQSEHLQKRQDRAHHRFLSAVRCLAQIRKLGVQVLQVNIGDKQINVVESQPSRESDELDSQQ